MEQCAEDDIEEGNERATSSVSNEPRNEAARCNVLKAPYPTLWVVLQSANENRTQSRTTHK